MNHQTRSELAGKTLRIRADVGHPCGGSKVAIEDWWDRIGGRPWGMCHGNPACVAYAIRRGNPACHIPSNDEVLYGKVNGVGYLVHMSELDLAGEG